jgi:hypothetical protein
LVVPWSSKPLKRVRFPYLAPLIICGLCHAQTLQRRVGPPELQPESCRDHVARSRHSFKDAADIITTKVDPEMHAGLLGVYNATGDQHQIGIMCEDVKLAKLYDLELNLAVYTRFAFLEAKGKIHVDEPVGKLPQ